MKIFKVKKIPCLFLKDASSQQVTPTIFPGLDWVMDPDTRATWTLGHKGFNLFEVYPEVRNATQLWERLRVLLCGHPHKEGLIFRSKDGHLARVRREDYGFEPGK